MADAAGMRALRPSEHVRAFFDGREPGRVHSRDWVGADLELGVASYAVVHGAAALVFDTHTSVAHGLAVRRALEAEGVRDFTVLLSHWHLDHVAGTAAFADCEVIATERAASHLARRREAIESGALWGEPAIDRLVLPTRTFGDSLELRVGALELRIGRFDIHTDDAAVLLIPATSELLAGDTLEDTVMYVDHPEDLEVHLGELARLRSLGAERIYPAHGDPARIEAGGYGPAFVEATEAYVRFLLTARVDDGLGAVALREVIAAPLADGTLHYHPPYERVHGQNLDRVRRQSA